MHQFACDGLRARLGELGVQTIAIPRQGKISPTRETIEHSRGFHRLVRVVGLGVMPPFSGDEQLGSGGVLDPRAIDRFRSQAPPGSARRR